MLPQRLQGKTRYIGRACIETFDITMNKVWNPFLRVLNRVPFVHGLASDWIFRVMDILPWYFKRGTTVRSNKVTIATILNISFAKGKGGES